MIQEIFPESCLFGDECMRISTKILTFVGLSDDLETNDYLLTFQALPA